MLNPKTNVRQITAITLCLLGISACGSFPNPFVQSYDRDKTYPPVDDYASDFPRMSLQTYDSCDALKVDVEAAQIRAQKNQVDDKGSVVAQPTTAPAEGASDKSSSGSETIGTNVQEAGVDEGDYVKFGDHHLYVLNGKMLHVIDRSSLKELGVLTLDNSHSSNFELFAEGDRLMILRQTYDSGIKTVIDRYDSGEGKMPQLLYSQSLTGYPLGSRLLKDKLFIVTKNRIEFEGDVVASNSDVAENPGQKDFAAIEGHLKPAHLKLSGISPDNQMVEGVACQDILKKLDSDASFDLTALHTINLNTDVFEEKVLGALGYADLMYMSAEHIYLSKSHYVYDTPINTDATSDKRASLRASTLITRINLPTADHDARAVAIGTVDGLVKDSWSFKDIPESNAVSIVSQDYDNRWQTPGARLTVLKQSATELHLDEIGSVEGIAPGETLHAIRYLGSYAYLVTFRQIDPLFVVDLSDLSHPAIKGELKVPGFSDYLHPVADGYLVGVGYDATEAGSRRGIQVSLFNVTDPANPQRVSVQTYGTWGDTPVASDPHAFFFDPETKLLSVPMTTNYDDRSKNEAGARILKVGDSLENLRLIAHAELPAIPECKWDGIQEAPAQPHIVDRMLKLDGRYLSFSSVGVMQHSGAGLENASAVVSFQKDGYCSGMIRTFPGGME